MQAGVNALGKEIDDLRAALKDKPALLDLLPDVQIYYNAVRYALTYNEFYDVKQTATAKAFLKQGHERAEALRDGKAPWTTATGLVARGYVSRIDGSVQPYGLVVPASFKADAARQAPPRPLVPRPRREPDRTEFHRRLPEVERRVHAGRRLRPAPLRPLLLRQQVRRRNRCVRGDGQRQEALPHRRQPRRRPRLLDGRGGDCWHLAVHYPSVWCAAAPGAGFSETADFLKVFQNEAVKPTWYEQKLYHMYDATDYAGNLFNCPTVAYSGADDTQKQAADMMAAAMKRDGLTLAHLIGPHTKHAYEPETRKELIRRIDRHRREAAATRRRAAFLSRLTPSAITATPG